MFRINALIVLLLLITATHAFSDTFIVTNKSDSGPGTLRQALLDAAANGTSTVDEIRFNLPVNGSDINDRTIRLRSQLPTVTSKVIIDGSTQPSPVLGVSGAKVIIEREFQTQYYSGLVISNSVYDSQTTDVEIYGLYIRGFANITSLSNVNQSQGSGILIEYKVNNIVIGKPGKGNVICGNLNGIAIRYTANNYNVTNALRAITIQSNFIGVMDNGNTVNTNAVGINAIDLYENSLTIGGDNANEGNVIAGNGTDISINRSSYNSSFRSTIAINGNKVGTDYTGKLDYKGLPIFSQSSSIEMYGIKVNAFYTDLNIFKNVISGHQSAGISIANASFMIGGNYIGTDINGTGQLGNTVGIRIETGATGKIGGSADADPNYIGYNTFGVDVMSNQTVTITRNSIYCNERFGIGQALNANQAYIQVLKQRNNYISGKANSNAEVELFYSDNCPGSCQGKQYIATVRADNAGRWEYNGPLSNHVVATASLNSYITSMFSTAALLPDEAIVEPYTCKGPGSITITEPREGITFEWYKLELNGASVKLPVSATTQKITNLEVGTYELRISDGCRTVPKTFAITDQVLIKPVITAPVPACGQVSFSFGASSFRGKGNISYTWYNGSNQVVGYGAQINLPQGTYTVKATDEAGCTLMSDPVTIVRKPAPVINTSAMTITKAACGKPNGSIKGITFTDVTGAATYQWYFFNTQTSKRGDAVTGAQSIDLDGVEGGYYQLEINDEGGCTPVYSNPLYIGIYNSVIINIGAITGTTCDRINGQVIGTTLQEADSYKLTNAVGTMIEEGSYYGIPFDFVKLPAGSYTLTASNSVSGCSYAATFTVPRITPQDYSFTANVVKTTCGLNNGMITLTYTSTSARPARYEWRDQTGQVLTGTQLQIKDLSPGDYTYVAYDANGCDRSYTYTIGRTDLLDINESTVRTVNDYCGLKRGSIKGLQVSGGVPNHTFKWIDENDKQVGSTLDLLNIGEGRYRLVLGDQTTCGADTSSVYTIQDESRPMDDPVVSDVRVCYTTEIMIPVTNAEEGTYQLFKDPLDATPVMESDKGIFIFVAGKSSDYYIRRKLGHCIGNFTKMHVEVTNDNLVIANTMTPNGDGINDIWSLTGLPDYPDITIQLYSRDGQLVYESIGQYNKPFDGRFRGAELPAGVYYYKIDLRGDCKPLSGSLTLLR